MLYRFAALFALALFPAAGTALPASGSAPPLPRRVVAQTESDIDWIAFSPDGSAVYTSGSHSFTSGSTRMWDVASGRLRHVFPGKVAAVSPDGTLLATGGEVEAVRLWSVATGELRRELGAGSTVSLTFTSDGSQVVAGGDHLIRVWDSETGQLRQLWSTALWRPFVAVSPDGAFVFAADLKGLERWDLHSRKQRQTPTGYEQQIDDMAVSRNGSFVATAGREGTVKIWEPGSGRMLSTLVGEKNAMTSVALSPDGNFVFTPGAPGRVAVWERSTGRLVNELSSSGADRLRTVAVTPDGRHALASGEGGLFVWDLATGGLRHTLRGGRFAVSRDGLSLAVATYSNLQIVDLASGTVRLSLCGKSEPFFGIYVTADGRSLVASEWNVSYLWDLATGAPPSRLGGTYSVNHAAVGGDVAVTADQVWERASGKPLRKLERRATAFAVSPDGSWIAAGGGDGIVRLFEAPTGRLHATLRGSASAITRIAFSPDLSSLAAGRHDGSLSIWSLDGELLQSLQTADTNGYPGLFMSPDGSLLVTAASDAPEVRIWDVRTGSLRRSLGPLEGTAGGMALSPDGRSLAVLPMGRMDRGAGVWDLASGKRRYPLEKYPPAPRAEAVSFSRDGRLLATASYDGTAQLWDAATGTPQRTLMAPTGIEAVALGPSGGFLAGLRNDNAIVLWDVASGAELATLYTFEAGDWAVVAPDGRWDAAKGGHSASVTVWQGDEPSSLAMHPDLHAPGLLRAVLEGRNEINEIQASSAPAPPQIRKTVHAAPTETPPESPVPGPSVSIRFAAQLLSRPRLAGTNVDVDVTGSHAFVASGDRGLQILDLSDPFAARVAGSFDTPGFLQSVRIAGATAYLADGHEGLTILDVTDPSSPALLSHLAMPNGASDLDVEGTYAYVADSGAGLQVVDVAEPRTPRIVGSFQLPRGSGFVHRVTVAGHHAFLGVSGVSTSNGSVNEPHLVIVDVSSPGKPSLASSYRMSHLASDIAVEGSLAFLAAGDAGLLILDVSNPQAAVPVGQIDTPSANGVAVANGTVYLSDGYLGLRLFDLSDPARPVIVGGLDVDSLGRIALAGDLLVSPAGCSGARIVRISPARPASGDRGSEEPEWSVHVGRAEAIFSLRRDSPLLEWEWYLPKTAGNALEYAWLVALANESQAYRLGFSLFKPPGASPRKGSLADLLRAGHANVWKTRGQELELVEGARVEVAVSADRLLLIVRDEKTLQLLFSEKPQQAVLHVLRGGEPAKPTATVINYDWEPP